MSLPLPRIVLALSRRLLLAGRASDLPRATCSRSAASGSSPRIVSCAASSRVLPRRRFRLLLCASLAGPLLVSGGPEQRDSSVGRRHNQGVVFRSLANMGDQQDRPKPNVVFVLGGPGAGKGTQCKKIVDEFGYVHLSAGDLLREEQNSPQSEFGALIADHLKNGTIVPVEITCSLLARAMKDSKKNDFLIDGFPRNEDNLQGWTRQMGDKVHVDFVLFFTCDKETCVKRCLDRGAAGSGRSDDNLESLKKRFETYVNATMPIIEHFRKLDLVVEIDATKTEDEVFEEVKKHFKKK